MKILFLASDIKYGGYVGIMYLSATLKEHGHKVKLMESETKNLCEQVGKFGPDVIAYSTTTGLHKYYLEINKKLKKDFKFISVFGGPHATYFPEIVEEDGVDAVCLGEGELAFTEFLDKLNQGDDIGAIKNFWVKKNGKIIKNPLRPLISNLDEIPFPDRELVYGLDSELREYPITFVMVSRGCPYRCPYCFNKSFINLYKDCWKVRIRSVGNVIEELKLVKKKQPLKFIQFIDSIFAGLLDMAWLEEFVKRYKAEIAIPFYCHVRANMITEDVVNLLKEAGCASVGLGIESGNDYLRNKVIKRNMTKEQIINACELLKNMGINISSQNMFGLPGGSLKDDLETVQLNIDAKVDYPVFMLWQPYPKTSLAEYAIKNGYFDGDIEKIDFSYYSNSVIKFKNEKDKRQIENLQKLGAIAVEAPFLLPLVKAAIKLPPNLFFKSIFRAWYSYCCERRITPHQMTFKEIMQKIKPLIGLHGG